MQQQDRAWQLIAGYLTSEASAEQLQELQQLTNADNDFKNTIETLAHFWLAPTEQNQNQGEITDAWEKHLKRIQTT